MENKCKYGSIGYIVKKESLSTYQTETPIRQLVLEDMHPFPGYYEFFNIPRNEIELVPRNLFAVMTSFRNICEDDIIRITQHVKEKIPDLQFDCVLGHITLFNQLRSVLRIKTEDLSRVKEILQAYENQGIKFDKNRNIKEVKTLIRVRKFLEMEEIEQDIFKDLEQENSYYIKLPHEVPWDEFEVITKIIKTNFEYKSFDAALGMIYIKQGVVDLLRVYDVDADIEKLRILKDRYEREIDQFEPIY
jgi:hypothetical protein